MIRIESDRQQNYCCDLYHDARRRPQKSHEFTHSPPSLNRATLPYTRGLRLARPAPLASF